MSTPPVPPNPSEPNSHEPNQDSAEARGGQPSYGQDAPQYGQNTPPAPQYGQNAPQYGQNTPPAPQFGQGAPQYGQNTPPTYGQGAPQYGQQSSAPSPYGQSPYGQSPYGYPSEQPQGGASAAGVPQLVNTSFWMIIGAGVLSVLLTILVSIPALDDPAMRSTFEEQLRGSGQNVTFDDIKGLIIGTMVVFALVGAGLYALVAFNVRKGKNLARILGTVFAALSVFSLFPLGLNTLVGLLGIAAIVMLYLPASAPYFQKPQPFANPYSQPGGPFGR